MLGRRPALRASAQSATGSFSFKNENALLSLFTASAWAPSCSPSPDRALRRQVTRPSVPPRPWIPGCPLVPVHYRAHCVHNVYFLLSDIWGLTHPGRETAQGPPSPSGVHPQPPLSTAHAKPEHLRASCRATEGSPEAPGLQELLERAGLRLCGPACPALAAQIPRPGLPHLPTSTGAPVGVEARCTVGARPQSPLRDQVPEPPAPAPKPSLASHAAEPAAGAALPAQGLTSAHCLARMRIWL